jgi:hypothetical protein
MDTRKGVVFHLGLGEGVTTPHRKNQNVKKCYAGFHYLDISFGTIEAMENGLDIAT